MVTSSSVSATRSFVESLSTHDTLTSSGLIRPSSDISRNFACHLANNDVSRTAAPLLATVCPRPYWPQDTRRTLLARAYGSRHHRLIAAYQGRLVDPSGICADGSCTEHTPSSDRISDPSAASSVLTASSSADTLSRITAHSSSLTVGYSHTEAGTPAHSCQATARPLPGHCQATAQRFRPSPNRSEPRRSSAASSVEHNP